MKWIGFVAALSLMATADTLVIPLGQQGESDLKTPVRGASMSAVVKHFGQPEGIKKGVGDPPITTWQYSGFRVYFEYDKVIHSVKNPRPSVTDG